MKILVIHSGAQWSTSDVYDGLVYGLRHHGVDVVEYRLDGRIKSAEGWANYNYRRARKRNPDIQKPKHDDILYFAGREAVTTALHHDVHLVIVVSALLLHPNVLVLLQRARVPVAILFTESPYDMPRELSIATMAAGCWTNERSALQAFQGVNARAGYLPHGWHPERHTGRIAHPEAPDHDVVFVGSSFPERVAFFNAIDWTGINLGLYGTWGPECGLRADLRRFTQPPVTNAYAASLYRNAKIGLNLHRTAKGFGPFKDGAEHIEHAESLNPRGYELAACGVFHLSDYRAEVAELFGDLVPTFSTPSEAEALIRSWLPTESGRAAVAAQLPARVRACSWAERAACVIGDVQTLVTPAGAAATEPEYVATSR